MAQGVVIRFKADSTEYDARLKRSIEQMKSMEDQAKKLQGSIDRTDEGYVKFVQSLGKMDTVAKSSKTALREYSEAILYLQQQYKALSDAEKSGEIGKAMAASIQQLKVRAAEAQDTIGDLNEELKHMASDTAFTDGIGLMTRTIGASASAIVAWTGDSKEMEAVIKDLAKIGTTVAAVDQLTKAFQKQNLVLLKNPYVAAAAAVVALGVAIGKLIQKSQELDGVQKTLNEVQAKGRDNAAKEMAQIDTLNSILHDNTRSLEERKTALAEIQNLVPDYHGALTEEGNLINDNTGAIDDYIDSLQRAALAQAAFDKMVELQKKKMQQQVELQEKQKSLQVAQARNEKAQGEVVYAGSEMTQVYTQMDTSSAERAVQQAEADIRATNAEIDALRNLVKATDVSNATTITTTGKGGKTAATGGVTTKELNPLQEAQRKISELSTEALTADEERTEAIRQEIEGLQEQVAEYKKIQDYVQGISQESEQEGLEPVMNGPEMSAFEKLQQSIRIKLADQNFEVDQASLTNLMTVAIQNGINGLDGAFEGLQYQLAEGINIPDEAWEELTAQINEQLANLGLDPIVLDVKTGNIETAAENLKSQAKGVGEGWNAVASAVNTVGGALQQIEDPGAKIAGIVAQAVANIALSFAEAAASPAVTSTGWGWLGFAAAGIATMISTIASIKSVTAGSYASGGIVPGNSYSGDNLTANVNSGELILNRAQQDSVASQLQGNNPFGNLALSMNLKGEDIQICLDNNRMRRGR